MLYPATEEVLAFQVRLTLCVGVEPVPPAVVPVPDSATFSDALPELLINDAVAGADPVLWGLNVSVNDAVFPAANVKGRVIPLIVYSALLVPADEITMLEPLAVKVPVADFVVPTAMLPKLMDAGETAKPPGATAVHESAMET